MKAILDHVGIAIADLAAALRFYRDGLGLDIAAPEDVASQRVRASFVPTPSASLELLEATAPESAIGRFIEKRGPGLHHITLRVEDIRAALDHLKGLGIRLIDEVPRPGAEGALVAFIHPSSAQGVLVELKQTPVTPSVASRTTHSARFALGDLELISVNDGFFRLDGGAMFGIVPKPLWASQAPPDDRNRIQLAMRPLVVRGARTMIIDAGLGDKESAKFLDIYGVDRMTHLDHSLAEVGLSAEDIDIVLASHLHFDHAGGFTRRDASGKVRPRFPKAQYVVRRGEWEEATHPNPRTKGSYLLDNYVPLAEAGVLQLVDEDQMIMPGVRVRRTGGHTPHHQIVMMESEGHTAAFVADLMPTTAHLPDAWVMGYDLDPVGAVSAKQQFVKDALEHGTLVFFEHDPVIVAGYLTEQGGKRTVAPSR